MVEKKFHGVTPTIADEGNTEVHATGNSAVSSMGQLNSDASPVILATSNGVAKTSEHETSNTSSNASSAASGLGGSAITSDSSMENSGPGSDVPPDSDSFWFTSPGRYFMALRTPSSSAIARDDPTPLTATRTGSNLAPSYSDDSGYNKVPSYPFQSAAETTFSALAGIVSSFLYTSNVSYMNSSKSQSYFGIPGSNTGGFGSMFSLPMIGSAQSMQDNAGCDDSTTRSGSKKSAAAITRHLTSNDLAMVLFQNPYNSVRGRRHKMHSASSLSAVRSLLTVLPTTQQQQAPSAHPLDRNSRHSQQDFVPSIPEQETQQHAVSTWQSPPPIDPPLITTREQQQDKHSQYTTDPYYNTPIDINDMTETDEYQRSSNHPYYKHPYSPETIAVNNLSSSETASQISEGTLRALRDLILDESVELHLALRFWTERWERPLLSWLEAGPTVWFSPTGYNHQFVGQKVAQIQAVLARRCASIGELQEHLLRAGWTRGVAQWGVLGQGEQWAAVAGFDGSVIGDESNNPQYNVAADGRTPLRIRSPSEERITIPTPTDSTPKFATPGLRRRSSLRDSAANVMVKKNCGGGIFVDDPSFLTEWSIDAIALVRRQLKRAARGAVVLPYEDNWLEDDYSIGNGHDTEEDEHERLILEAEKEEATALLPIWASEIHVPADLGGSDASAGAQQSRLVVTDLSLLVEEVSELLYKMEDIMMIQRMRRLEVLKPPKWLRRNWYMLAAATPPLSYILIKMLYNGYGRSTIKRLSEIVSTFFRERVREPVVAIFNEIWKGRESFSDREARMEAIESLKKMIKDWLDYSFPDMPEDKKLEISEAMDVTLIEQKKVESMRTFYEINNVIRMSFIEMQYMKKELLNALEAIDEMMSANDMTTNVAAITPVAMLAYVQYRLFRFFYYAMLKLGKSREETYESFRNVLTDIDRLLVMRDDPPNPPSASPATSPHEPVKRDAQRGQEQTASVLGADDLGMLMLLIHELRSILWQDSRRFSPEITRSVLEDLAELAGERGAVSVRQQLQIIQRMSRTYFFLQPTPGSGHFRYSRFRAVD